MNTQPTASIEIETYEACIMVIRGSFAIHALMSGFHVHARNLDSKYPVCHGKVVWQPHAASWKYIDHDINCPRCLERMKELGWN